MKHNPYLDLYTLMGQATDVKPSFYLGKVISELPNLQVKLNDIILNSGDLLIDKWLLDRSTLEYISYTEDGGHVHVDTTGEGLHTHKFSKPLKNKIEVGDTLVLLPTDSRFIIISKVVSL